MSVRRAPAQSIAFFIVLGVCLVAPAPSRSTSAGSSSTGAQAGSLIARRPRLPAHHHRRRPQHHLPGARNPAQRAARRVHQRRHARAEDAGRVDAAVPADAAEPRHSTRRSGRSSTAIDARGQRSPAGHHRAGAARRAAPAPSMRARSQRAGRPSARSCRSASTLARTRHHLPPRRVTYREQLTTPARRRGCSATRTS